VRVSTARLYWWNGVTWLPVSNYTIDPVTGTITITITPTTSPSTADLGGTPIILTAIPKLIGGSLAVEGASITAPAIAMALVLIAAIAGVVLVRRKA